MPPETLWPSQYESLGPLTLVQCFTLSSCWSSEKGQGLSLESAKTHKRHGPGGGWAPRDARQGGRAQATGTARSPGTEGRDSVMREETPRGSLELQGQRSRKAGWLALMETSQWPTAAGGPPWFPWGRSGEAELWRGCSADVACAGLAWGGGRGRAAPGSRALPGTWQARGWMQDPACGRGRGPHLQKFPRFQGLGWTPGAPGYVSALHVLGPAPPSWLHLVLGLLEDAHVCRGRPVCL